MHSILCGESGGDPDRHEVKTEDFLRGNRTGNVGEQRERRDRRDRNVQVGRVFMTQASNMA